MPRWTCRARSGPARRATRCSAMSIPAAEVMRSPSSTGSWPPNLLGSGDPGVPAGDQIAVPAQHGLRAHQQLQVAQDVAGEPVQQGGEPGPVSWGEADFLAVQLPFEDRDLMAQCQDLGILVRVAHRQQPQQYEGVGQAEVGQSKQHNGSSWRSAQRRSPLPRARGTRDCVGTRISVTKVAMTRTDEVFGTCRRKQLTPAGFGVSERRRQPGKSCEPAGAGRRRSRTGK